MGAFTSFTLTEYMMNRKIGYVKNVLDIFQYMHIAVEHIPTSIDSVSILVRSSYIKDKSKKLSIVNAINSSFNLVDLDLNDRIKAIAIVGEGLKDKMSKALYIFSKVLDDINVNIEYIIQGASNNSLFIFVDEDDEDKALKALYKSIYEEESL